MSSILEGRSVLVTGGAGYIGSHACKALATRGARVAVADSFERGHRDFARWGSTFECDLRDPAAVARVVRESGAVAVLHFAGYALVGESFERPDLYYESNVVASFHLLRACAEAGVRGLVFSSTCATYGDPIRVPLDEDHPQNPLSPYGTTKLAIERMIREMTAARGPRHAILRYFNAAGADPDGEIGEDHRPETHLIPLVLDAAAGRREAISVFGSDYPTPDGTCVRDYVHVCDLADAHVLALERLLGGGDSATLNLGTGAGSSVLEVVRAVERVTGRSVPLRIEGRRPGDPPILVADPARARATLGWTPTRSDLETILRDAWAWHRQRFGDSTHPGEAR